MSNKCEHKNEKGDFCGSCGERIKEKCPECGEMERIGRKICKTKANEMQIEIERCIESAGCAYDFMAHLGGGIIIVASFVVFIKSSEVLRFLFSMPVGIFLALIWGIVFIGLKEAAEERAGQKFLKEFPEYKKILEENCCNCCCLGKWH